MSHDLIDTTEMYLRTVFELEEEGTPPLRARIAERLEQSGPTVSQTVARMERDGLLTVGEDRHINLSIKGRARAARVMRKHRLAECLLVEVLELEWDLVHDEACRWEHVISEDVERRLLEVLDHPTVSPFGNPIPALDELEPGEHPTRSTAGLVPLARAAEAGPGRATVRRIDETAQADHSVIEALYRSGVRVGETVEFRGADGVVHTRGSGEFVELALSAAAHVLVEPIAAEED